MDLPKHIRDAVVAGMTRVMHQERMIEKMQSIVEGLEHNVSSVANDLRLPCLTHSQICKDRMYASSPSFRSLDSPANPCHEGTACYKSETPPTDIREPGYKCTAGEGHETSDPPPLVIDPDSDTESLSDMDDWDTDEPPLRYGTMLTCREDFETFVDKTTQSRTLSVLWHRFASKKGWSSWDDIDKGNLSNILAEFRRIQDFYLPQEPPPSMHDNFRFTSGWEEFFTEVCGVQLSLWSNPWASPSAEYWHPDDTGGLGINAQMPLLQVLNGLREDSACFVNTALCSDVSDDVFRVLNRKLRSFEKFRLVCVTQRSASAKWNSFLQTWEQKGRAVLCGAVRCMNLRTYGCSKETWSRVDGPWEVYVLDSGIQPVGHRISASNYSEALRGLIGGKSRSEWFPLPSFPDDKRCQGHAGFKQSEVQDFWDRWDAIALQRDSLLKARPVDWNAVRESLHDSNRLLCDAKDSRLRRIARLAKLPLTWRLDEVGSWVYTICGPYPPYVGQTGCFQNQRSCMERYREHLQKARSLANHFSGIRHRKIRAAMGFGKLPSLARMLAREGPSRVTIVALQDVANKQAGAVERWWNTVLGQTLNQVTPFGGIDAFRVERMLGAHSKTVSLERASLSTMVHSLLREGECKTDKEMDDRWWFVTCVAGKIEPNLFERFFKHVVKLTVQKWKLTVKRRLVLRIPCFDQAMQAKVRGVCVDAMKKLLIPPGLREWFAKSICTIPVPFVTIRDALSGGGRTVAPKFAVHALENRRACDPTFCSWTPLPKELGVWKVQGPPEVLEQVCEEALSRLREQTCMCSEMRRGSPSFGGFLDHVVVRTPEDWSHLFEPAAVRIL